MPIFKIDGKLVYFAHVPKSAGTSVAEFFEAISDGSAMIFDGQWKQRRRMRWSSTSPQHIPYSHLQELFPDDFFDYAFAVVRHPEDRILSEYRFRAQKSCLHRLFPFSEWLRIVLSCTKKNPFIFDGHLRPQVDFIPPGARVFKLEEGMDNLVTWVCQALGLSNINQQFSKHANRSVDRPIPISDDDRKLIEDFYVNDYVKFGYDVRREPNLPRLHALRSTTAKSLGSVAGLFTRVIRI